ncbi:MULTISPECIES: aminotransferase class III-fold pyridoxal phosphate-dependent enzyme [unclassified Colwellia]|uniref:aminotransferase class III-fold pyridoxal phosphate-dependent enzyme n=1 Tax=unclassified Colwellia TaxID=196834 RepID=UPI0015F676A2|nr:MULTISPECIES: aminotransferase class III-fold pyridoxal phosphate-dependent enzyme [unclassified Colwellia]MBA6233404.1 aminotransferase class III-fold pyridoxal phosphate-dependent enzyme [Colwellia sp. MB02u-7]MBA6236494.1 aminotransferase class III-fold pyridoxal phosphate-dependent enzyme [Colwellia sp. MB02u-11]MBA6298107.1 aminotransferase class III-fold pyridoxal phosphate-dependent enzyme [Colwellia sp. MB3u-22]MBA6312069.1 aminotransferase class III-fold pyridoxal phosphate-dependen
MNKKFTVSEQLLNRAEQSIPLGSQTFSKSKLVYPLGVSPLFIKHGSGCLVWDADDNQYIDFVNGLLSISLGYCDVDVDTAVIEQIKSGVIFSLPHLLEMEVAEQIIELIPSAEMVRFGKNGSDVTSAAIRIARAYTGQEHIAVCGYHGWQDWYIGSTTRSLGVPECVKSLTHKFNYNDISSLEKVLNNNSGKIAAIILEPMNVFFPKNNFLQQVKALAAKHNAVLIFDEIITGFRFHLNGAQHLFDVTPDISTFGKGIANGFPLSVIAGKKELMMLMEDIFYSGTFGGETLSLAAAKATINKFKASDVLAHTHAMGDLLINGLNTIITKHNAQALFSVSGHKAWPFLLVAQTQAVTEQELSSYIQQEMHARGILVGNAHNISYAHQKEHIQTLLNAYDDIIPKAVRINAEGNFTQHFHGVVTKPVFKVR